MHTCPQILSPNVEQPSKPKSPHAWMAASTKHPDLPGIHLHAISRGHQVLVKFFVLLITAGIIYCKQGPRSQRHDHRAGPAHCLSTCGSLYPPEGPTPGWAVASHERTCLPGPACCLCQTACPPSMSGELGTLHATCSQRLYADSMSSVSWP